ncbi:MULTISPECIES: histidine phosphatase family protein [unclassified Polynucleobacter]|jgi:2,3-bisphosphoglycerate-dependent phosphoglycerate mutase|uniref:histidine phosphatase family protein n=1 Tax=unclassified Polynucleobacter TaxID=2640945 RepID=UPI001BFDF8E6|nr:MULTISPECIES: histidine phosphatase family protein [unclassified Polynucleobacter]MBU3548433.1 histidine phosphatase family protein [Polynucleobacter sp. P1-05-14]MBU3638162.1 histidine phosphatase family protein [Polynucleobacter sp. AP-RePozz3-80-G7]QWD81555.1 histidine phosphatase family protein [Polynucleobacter sp. MWH-S4W17]
MTITRFCLVRHGETDWNAARRLQGHTDIDLNARGLAQAGQMARALKNMKLQFDVLYTSDLQRAAKTAQAIEDVFETSAIPNAGLRERHLGALQGLTTDEAPIREPELWKSHLSRNIEESLHNGESIQQFADRIKAALVEICEEHSGKTILLVSHGGALDMMYRIASNQALDAEKAVTVPNASLNWISHDGLAWKVNSWADISHLQDLALDNLDL